MSLVFDRQINGPQTHVLIMGVGGYPYLKDGEKAVAQTINGVKELGQLTSPPKSALALVDFLLKHPDHWTAPLGTIDLLISTAPDDPDPAGDGTQFQPATMENCIDAWEAWKSRCDAHPDNIALFFFSGHGLEKDEQFLLTEDFGRSASNPWRGAFAFDSTRRAFRANKAQTQCFFVDACRVVPVGALTLDLTIPPLDIPNILHADCQNDITIQAAAHNEKAFGKIGEPSFFTQAIIRAFSGDAARKEGKNWVVKSGDIAAQMTDILATVQASEGYPQRCRNNLTNSATLFNLPEPPFVRVEIETDPTEAVESGELACTPLGTGTPVKQPSGSGLWKIELAAGIYRADITFHNGDFEDGESIFSATPPFTRENISLTKITP